MAKNDGGGRVERRGKKEKEKHFLILNQKDKRWSK